MRLWTTGSSEDVILCNNEKLASGSTAAYIYSADKFLRDTIFAKHTQWPDVILTQSILSDNDGRENMQVEVSSLVVITDRADSFV